MKTRCEQYGERHLIQLHPFPERLAIHPEILRKAAIFLLSRSQIDQSAQRRIGIAGRKQSHGALYHVTGPDKVITALALFVVARRAPGNRERCDKRAPKQLVFVSQQQVVTRMVEFSLVAAGPLKRLSAVCRRIPLVDKTLAVCFVIDTETLEETRYRAGEGFPERHANCKLTGL